MKKIEGGITAAKGFQAAGGAAGIKKQGVKDMALVYSEVPCVAAGTFTTNIVKAAPVKWDQEIVYNHPTAQAIVCNSGIANACTGEEGYGYCRKTAEAASAALSIPEDSVLVASTGVIGKQIPIDKIAAGVEMLKPQLAATREAAATAAQAIMTTDTEPKEVAVQIEIGGKTVTIGSMCKGSGMIHPNMCTMLSFVTTDIAAAFAGATWLLIEKMHTGKPKFVGFLTGAVAGLATITPAAGYVSIQSAALIGIIAGFVCYYCALFVKKYVDDALDVFGVHGMGGITGSILLGVFASQAWNSKGPSGLLEGGGILQVAKQLSMMRLTLTRGGAAW